MAQALEGRKHPMKEFFLDRPLLWGAIALIPGGLFLATCEYDARNEGVPRGLPWPFALGFGIAGAGILICAISLFGGPLFAGYLASKVLGGGLLLFSAMKD